MWSKDLKEHFVVDENILIPALRDTSFNEHYTERLLSDHAQIRLAVERIEEDLLSNISLNDLS